MSRGWLVFIWTLIGTIIGQLVGHALASQFAAAAWLDKYLPLSITPTSIDLGFVVVTLGIVLKLSLGGAIGLVLSLWLALRNA